MSHSLVLIFAFSIIVPAGIAMVRINKIERIYFPFIICIWTGLLNECISYILIDIFHVSNLVNSDIFCLTEALLYTWLFKNLDLFANRMRYLLLITFLCAVWLSDILVRSEFISFLPCFTIIYSFMIVSMSITLLNRLILSQLDLLTNPIFPLCIALIIYFSMMALVEVFWLYGLDSSNSFELHIYRIMSCINVFVNLIFTLAILWMHRRQEFTPLQ